MLALEFAPFSQGLLLAVTLIGVYGLINPDFREAMLLDTRRVVRDREFYRVASASLVNSDWSQLVINLAVLALVAPVIERMHGAAALLLIYPAGLIAGSLWMLLDTWKRQEGRAIGAGGASMALVVAFALSAPSYNISMLEWMPAVVASGAFLGWTLLVTLRKRDEFVCVAPLIGGALVALAIVCVAWPDRVRQLPARITHYLAPPQPTSTGIDTITIRPDD